MRPLFLALVLAGCAATTAADDAASGTDGSSPIDGGARDAASSSDAPSSSDASADDTAIDAADPPGTWRSALFPRDWTPVHEGGSPDAQGRALADFAYAGWHRGDQRPPYGAGTPSITVDAALGDGTTDATHGIQSALDATCASGGGIVQLPAGTFVVRLPSPTATAALLVSCSHIVLRGAGPDRTHVLVDDPLRMRDHAGIAVRGSGSSWDAASTTTFALTDTTGETDTLSFASAPAFVVGDWIAIRNTTTEDFRVDHRMDQPTSGLAGLWPADQFRGLLYLRRVTAIAGASVTLDAPIHHGLLVRDMARAYSRPGFLEEVGLESFSIGMTENGTTPTRGEPTSDDDYLTMGTTGYEVHASRAIELERVHDAWMHDVDSFRPMGNTLDVHVLSSGVLLGQGASRVTIEDCDFANPQYRGGGGNGYLFHVAGSDALLVDDTSRHARHGFIINQAASGNVFLRVRTTDSRYSNDSHRFLAHANLYDGVVLDGDWLQAVNRGTTSSGAGFTSTEHVFWNTHVVRNAAGVDGCAVESAQFGWGYLIGSRADTGATAALCPRSFTNSGWAALDMGAPADFVEGEAMGDTLAPSSLFAAQLALRCAREGIVCASW